MSKVSKIIDDIRDTLSDPEGDRWHNDRLIRSINEAMRDINQKAKVLRSKAKFSLTAGISTYKLEDEVQLLTRCLYKGVNLEFKSHDQMDLISDTWEEDIGDEVQYIVYDHLNRGELKIYPIMASDITEITPQYGVISALNNITFNSPYGVVTSLYEPNGEIVLYYIKKPNSVTGLNDFVDLDGTWDKAIRHYVCGNVLRDDKDTQNRQFGNEELQLYISELTQSHSDISLHFQTTAIDFTAEYRSL